MSQPRPTARMAGVEGNFEAGCPWESGNCTYLSWVAIFALGSRDLRRAGRRPDVRDRVYSRKTDSQGKIGRARAAFARFRLR